MGWWIVGEEQETGVSGYKVSAENRDKIQIIKQKAEQGTFDILLVFMFDRLGRKSATGRRTVRARKPPSVPKQP